MKNMMKVITTLSIVSLMLITFGVTYSFFSYLRSGTTENTITSGAITFHYQEGNRSISVNEAVPISDTNGKAQTQYFDFEITSDTVQDIEIPYVVTARMSKNSTLNPNAVKIWISDQSNTEIEEAKIYGTLEQYSEMDVNKYVEKVIYTGKVNQNQQNYSKDFRVRIWIDESVDFSSGNYDDKTFTLTFNVYSHGTGVTQGGNNQQSSITYYDFEGNYTSWEIANDDIRGGAFCLPGVGQSYIDEIIREHNENGISIADEYVNHPCVRYNEQTGELTEYVSPTTPPAGHTVYAASDGDSVKVCIIKGGQEYCLSAFDRKNIQPVQMPDYCYTFMNEIGVYDVPADCTDPYTIWWNRNARELNKTYTASECRQPPAYVTVWQCETPEFGCYFQQNGTATCKNLQTEERCHVYYDTYSDEMSYICENHPDSY